jgi:hypothetical protein
MADHRAMEEQNERLNPVNEKELLAHADNAEHRRRLSGQGMYGGSATPSMGLSMYRGGRLNMADMEKKMAERSYSRPVNRVKASEARMMGQALGKHLYGLHGGSFHKDFCSGMNEGSGLYGGDFFEDEMREAKRDEEFRARQKRNTDAGRHPNDNGDGYFGLMPDEAHKKKQAEIDAQGARDAPISHAIGKYGMRAVNGLTDAFIEHGTKFGAPQMLVDGIKKAREVGQKGFGRASRAKEMLGQNKAGRSRNNGPSLLSGNVNGNVSGSGLTPEQLKKRVSEIAKKGIKRLSPSKMTLNGGAYGRSRMVGSGTGAGMLEEPMPMPGNNLNLSGGADTGAYEGQGKGGRSARASIVKRVMAEKGMKMIEASKYVKAHNLY